MKITPALPNPYQLPMSQDRSAVSALQASCPVRDPTERTGPGGSLGQPAKRADPGAYREPAASQHTAHSLRSSRALASYTRVAEYGERSSLHDLLGFDVYA